MRTDNYRKVDLAYGLVREKAHIQAGMGDADSLRIGAELYLNGEAASAAGSEVKGYFLRPDGVTVTISGSVEGNTVYCDLPQDCFYYAGHFVFSLQIIDATAVTVRMVEGNVEQTRSGIILDNGQTYSLEELNAAIADKMDKPATEGAAGQVLTADGQGGASWQNADASNVAGTVQVNGTAYTLRTGSAGAAGYMTFVMEA